LSAGPSSPVTATSTAGDAHVWRYHYDRNGNRMTTLVKDLDRDLIGLRSVTYGNGIQGQWQRSTTTATTGDDNRGQTTVSC
jgi:hypothetical protein